jgi:heme oxygenase
MTAIIETSPPLSARLREETADDHHRAERSEFQRLMVGGRLSRDLYAQFLGEMLVVWRALERAAPTLASHGSLAPLVEARRFRSGDIERDLAVLNPAIAPRTEAATRFADAIDQLGAARPHELVGTLYVLEGSTNGGRFIAKAVRRAYRLDGHDGTSFLDPYGDEQPELWAAWRAGLDAAVAEEHHDAVIANAREAFRAVEAIGSELLA